MAALPCKIYMFFGEKIIDNKLVVFKTADKNSFIIKDFSCLDLKAALPMDAAGEGGINFDKFDLSEAELLSLSTMDNWVAYCMHASNPDTLGQLAFKSIYNQGELTKIIQHVANAFLQMHEADGGSLTGLGANGWRGFQGPEFKAKWATFRTVYSWLENIMRTYYGKQFVVKVGNDASGICVKDKFGNKPAFNVKVDGEGGPFVTTDSPAQDGGWPKKGVRQVLGLDIGLDTEIFHSDDSRITTFVKMGKVKDIEKSIKKGGKIFTWDIDIENMGDTQSWKIKKINDVDILYAKAEVTGLVYFIVEDDRDDDPGHFVHFEVSNPITLKLSKKGLNCDGGTTYPGLLAALSLYTEHVGVEGEEWVRTSFCNEKDPAKPKVDGAPTGRDHINVLGMKNLAIFPVGVVVPLKSNVFVYGPWSFVANPVGGTLVEPIADLCPWNFAGFGQDDGYDRMNLVGRLIASEGPKNYDKAEEGNITVACLPNFNMGAAVGGNTALLKDIVITFGSSGVTTTYQFNTYSARFGTPARHLLDAWSSNYKMLTKLRNYFKAERLKIVALANQQRIHVAGAVAIPGAVAGNRPIAPEEMNSPSMLLISAYLPKDYSENSDGGQDNIVATSGPIDNWDPCYYTAPTGTIPPAPSGSKNLHDGRSFSGISEHTSWEFVQPNTYEQLSIMTLDGLFSPVSLSGVEGGRLPRLALYHQTTGDFIEFKGKVPVEGAGKPINSKTKDEIPPFTLTLNKSPSTIYNREINQKYLNAYTSKKILENWNWDGRKTDSNKGFIIFGISYGDDWKKMSLGKVAEKGAGDIEERENQEDFRFSALKGPLMLQSWGYDTSGKPVPNAVDSAKNAQEGKFRKAGLTDNFMSNWLSNPKTWPVGPIDLRFDRERGVWVCPPGNKIVVAKLRGTLKPYGKVEAELVNAASDGVRFYEEYTIWGPLGENIKENIRLASIEVYDYLGVTLDKGDIVYAYYDEGRYIILESSRSYNSNNFNICTTAPTPTVTASCWCGLECLQTLENYDKTKTQALIHKEYAKDQSNKFIVRDGVTLDGCLSWENIVECSTPATPLPGR